MKKKTAPKTSKKASPKKAVVAKKKVTPVKATKSVKVSKSSASSAKKSFWGNYIAQREQFYQTHPYSRFLIGLLIISFAVAVGMCIHDWKEVYVGLALDAEGIDYPYVEPLILVKE